MNTDRLRTQRVFPLVLSMGIPMAFSMLINALYNIVDGYFVARLSEQAMTAVSLVFPLQYAASAAAIGTGVGISAAVSFFLGAGEKERADDAASVGLLLSFLHGILLTILIPLLGRPFLLSFTKDETVINYGTRYLNLVMSCTLAMQVQLVYEKLYQSVGKMRTPVICLALGCISNIILDPVLIFGLGPFPEMGIDGAALATDFGTILTLVLYLIVSRKGRLPFALSPKRGAIKLRLLAGRIYRVGIPAACSLLLQSIMVALLNGILAAFGEDGVFVLGVYYKLQSFLYLTASGVVQGIRPPVSYSYGAGDVKRVREIFKTASLVNLVLMLVGTLLCLLVPGRLFALFTSRKEVLDLGSRALRLICLGFPVSALSVTAAGTLEALGEGASSFVISFLRCVGLLVPLALVFSKMVGMDGVFAAFPAAEAVTAVIAFVMIRRSLLLAEKRLRPMNAV
ncbi:MAG: MATE family efflux transporter [Lachnospiraceae bacterium]|nr:MATE family efflux transporter [Lachnospiraceae bacterium]